MGLLMLASAWPVVAARVQIEAERVVLGPGSGRNLHITLDQPAAGPAVARVVMSDFDSGLGWRYAALSAECELTVTAEASACIGALQADRLRRALNLAWAADGGSIILAEGRRRLAARFDLAQPDRVRVQAQALPVSWAQPFLATVWATAQPSQGRFGGEIEIRFPASGPLRTLARLDLDGLGLDTPDGSLAAAGVSGRIDIDQIGTGGGSQVRVGGRLTAGEFLWGTVYVGLGAEPVEGSLDLVGEADGGWTIAEFKWSDGATLSAQGSGRIEADGGLTALRVHAESATLAALAERYLSGPLGLAGLAGMRLSGRIAASVELARDGPVAITVAPEQVVLVDAGGRFRFAGLDGVLRWTAADQPVESDLAWSGAAMHGIGIGPVRLAWRSHAGALDLRQPATLELLSGRLELERLHVEPPMTGRSAVAELALTVVDVDLAALSQALGWPSFSGTLSGRLPMARYARQRLDFDGGLSMRVFDGNVAIRALSMERVFGVAPSLAAEVEFTGLDLQPLTAAFGFGEITGRLDGHLHRLRLLDWQPVAFDAALLSAPVQRGPKRISQRAVQDISRIGGSGLIAGLQGQALKMFSTFGYARLGLRCRLDNNVCSMDGVGSAGDGYTIVEGAGLPRINVVGFQRRVDWPVLVGRLKAATEGQLPTIE